MAVRGRLTRRRLAIPLLGALVAAALAIDFAWSQTPSRRGAYRIAQLPALAPELGESQPTTEAQQTRRFVPTEDALSGQSLEAQSPEVRSAEEIAAPEDEEIEDYTVPLRQSTEGIMLESEDGLISLVARNAPLQDILTALAETQGLNLITQESVSANINTTLNRVPFEDVLDIILSTTGFTWVRNRNVIQVTSISDAQNLAPETQGRLVEVFHLDYVSATDVSSTVQTMLSPAGSATVIESAQDNNLRTQEILVVQDLPGYIENIRHYIRRHDIPPRQVLIEAYILKVELGDDMKHGVDYDHLFSLAGNSIQLESRGLTNPATGTGFLVNLSGGNLGAVVEILESTTDAKTLASPKIRVLNGQTARIQVGEQLGFRVTTTTETSTTESVEFLDVGVVLEVTPRIGSDGTVIMRVSPEVSSGQVNPATGLPEEETTELQTDVMFRDNQAYVIGGLIQETDTDQQTKLPWLGTLKYIGFFFQRAEVIKRRSEIVIALVPRVMPFDQCTQDELLMQTESATTPLLYGPLLENPRPWEAELPGAYTNPHMHRLPPTWDYFSLQGDYDFELDAVPTYSHEQPTHSGIDIPAPTPAPQLPPPVYTSQRPAPARANGAARISRLPPLLTTAPKFQGFDAPAGGTMLR